MIKIKSQHRTLARTLAFIGWHSPSDFGLFWNSDGTMPWKEFYWALQEDPELRFVRTATIQELTLLGIELPFCIEQSCLRLNAAYPTPVYASAHDVPERLYFAIKPNNLDYAQEFGLKPSSRPFLPLCSDRELALRIARRRESDPILIEVKAREAHEAGIPILMAGEKLYLVETVPRDYLLIPLVRRELREKVMHTAPPKKKVTAPPSPGSFTVQSHYIHPPGHAGETTGKGGPGKKSKGGWKKESRKERYKRSI